MKKKTPKAKWRKEYLDTPEIKAKREFLPQDLALSVLEVKTKGRSWWLLQVYYLITALWFLRLELRGIYDTDLYIRKDPFAVAFGSDVVTAIN